MLLDSSMQEKELQQTARHLDPTATRHLDLAAVGIQRRRFQTTPMTSSGVSADVFPINQLLRSCASQTRYFALGLYVQHLLISYTESSAFSESLNL